MAQKLEHREQRMALEELLEALRQEEERVERLEQAIREAVPEWSKSARTHGYLGLVPSERSTGDKVKRGGITKAGNGRARRILIEAAWAYRHPARVGLAKQPKVAATPRRVREIAWKAQTRLCARFRSRVRKGKNPAVAAAAIAREFAAFAWAINREVMASRRA